MATILVVDDVATNREVLVTLLRYRGHAMLEAADGRAALAVAIESRPDLVITDVLMPVMDGYEFVRQLRQNAATKSIPVVFYTAHYGEREARSLALSSGVSYVLTKPVESDAVLAVVHRALRGESETEARQDPTLPDEFDHAHLRLVTDKLSEKAADLGAANARLRALINIGLELASERNPDRLLETVCVAARDLFGATYAVLGVCGRESVTIQRIVQDGAGSVSLRVGETITGPFRTAVVERRTVRGDHLNGDEAHTEAFVIAPIASPLHSYGLMCLVRGGGGAFTEDDEQLVRALGGQVGRIYENGYYYNVARHERDRAQRFLDTAQVILLALDLEGRITLANSCCCTLLGWRSDELLGRNWADMCLPARLRGGLRTRFADLLAGDLSIMENPVLTSSGEERLIEWRNTLLRDDTGAVIGTFSSGTDITEQARAVEALRTAEERMRFALENADIGIWDMDYRTGILKWSEAIEAHHGFQSGTFSGKFDDFVQRIHPADRASALQTIDAARKSGADFTLQYRATRPNGSVRWLTGAGRILLGENGEPVRGIGITMDITERRTLEEQYQQAQKMEAIGRLAGGIAHDFNNLLTAILGYCELLLADGSPTSADRADITEIHKAGMRAAALTQQLLAFSRKQIIEPTLLDLNVLVSEMQPMLGRLIGEDVSIILALQPGLALVRADRGQVQQVVMNLAVNARDAMPTGGTLTIDTANVELDDNYAAEHFGAKPGAYVALTVTDTGTGMTPEVRARLFEPFFTTKEPGKGTGLGMATIHGIVTRNGGTVGVYSEVGMGTSFNVYFPRADVSQVAAEVAPLPRRKATGTQTVLLVEDAEGLRELAKRLLQRHGYTVLVARNADEAIRLFEQNAAIDVLLTDVVMPGASGPELTRQLVKQRPTLKVLYMSGYTDDAIVQHGILKPGTAFLNKPFTSETLGQKIREVLDA